MCADKSIECCQLSLKVQYQSTGLNDLTKQYYCFYFCYKFIIKVNFNFALNNCQVYSYLIVTGQQKMIGLLAKTGFKFSSEFNKVVYVNGKSALSLSQMIGGNRQYIDPCMDNFYIKQHTEHQAKHEGQIARQLLQNQQRLLQSVLQKDLIVRCIIAPEISKKQMNLNINKLKKNPLLHHLIQLSEKKDYKFNSPRILINSYMHIDQAREILENCQNGQTHIKFKENQLPVHNAMHGKDSIKQEVWIDKGILVNEIEQHLKKNIVELQKLFVDGFSLDLSFMLSKRNLHHPIKSGEKQKRNFWLNCIQKKSKAIHSNIVQNGLNLSETIHEQSYQLHHVFLSSFNQKKQRISGLANNKGYDLKQVLYILSMINFKGKLVLDCQDPNKFAPGTGASDGQQFTDNLQYLDRALKQIGYKKTTIDQVDDGSYISAL